MGKQHEEIYNNMTPERKEFMSKLNNFVERTGSKSISEASGVERRFKEKTEELHANINKRLETREFAQDKAQAEIELSYINAAITLAQGSNDIGAEIVIGPFAVGISLNARLISVLQEEAIEINKYLKGLPNNYE